MVSQFRRRLGTKKNAASASAVPPLISPRNCRESFFAVDGAVVVTVRVDV